MSEHPPIYPDEHGDWSAANRGYERRIREWVSKGVHLQAHHVAYVLAELDAARKRADQAESQRAAQGWQPIETAPKHKVVLVCWSHQPEWSPRALDQQDDGTWENEDGHTYRQPTHWMPLPSPPEETR